MNFCTLASDVHVYLPQPTSSNRKRCWAAPSPLPFHPLRQSESVRLTPGGQWCLGSAAPQLSRLHCLYSPALAPVAFSRPLPAAAAPAHHATSLSSQQLSAIGITPSPARRCTSPDSRLRLFRSSSTTNTSHDVVWIHLHYHLSPRCFAAPSTTLLLISGSCCTRTCRHR